MQTGLKKLYFRNVNNPIKKKINLDVTELLNQNIDLIVQQNVKKEKKITINTIKNINNRLYLLE